MERYFTGDRRLTNRWDCFERWVQEVVWNDVAAIGNSLSSHRCMYRLRQLRVPVDRSPPAVRLIGGYKAVIKLLKMVLI